MVARVYADSLGSELKGFMVDGERRIIIKLFS